MRYVVLITNLRLPVRIACAPLPLPNVYIYLAFGIVLFLMLLDNVYNIHIINWCIVKKNNIRKKKISLSIIK